MQQWDYQTGDGLKPPTRDALDAAGKEGWELVSVVLGPDGTFHSFFKRPIEPKKTPGRVRIAHP